MPIYEVCIKVNDASGANADWKDGMPVTWKVRSDPLVPTNWGQRELGHRLRVLVFDVPPSVEAQLLVWLEEHNTLEQNKRKTYVIEYWDSKNGLTPAQITQMRDDTIIPDVRYDMTGLDLTKNNVQNNLIGLA